MNTKTVGFIVGRFQVHQLHPGHERLFRHTLERHERVIVLVGVTGGVPHKKCPLPFDIVKVMIEQTFCDYKERLTILPIEDHPFSHVLWVHNVDRLLKQTVPGATFVGYGSRDSFLKEYAGIGEFETVRVPELPGFNGTDIRTAIDFPHSPAARQALIWYHATRHDFLYSTSDLAIVDLQARRVLLVGKSKWSDKRAFMGGHGEKTDLNARKTAVRERGEEIKGITIGELTHVDSIVVHDPRYRGTEDGNMTSFYWAEYLGGEPKGDDDVETTHWVSFDQLLDTLVPWHLPLGRALLEHFAKRDTSAAA
jgi:bifunctional NMN adenylyltransferase/nudix hydrolase